MGGVPPPCSPSHDHDPFVRISYLLFPFFSHICALFCAILHFLARIKYATLFFSSDSALFGKNTRGGVRVCVGTRFLFVAATTYCERVVGRAQFVATTCSCHTDSGTPPRVFLPKSAESLEKKRVAYLMRARKCKIAQKSAQMCEKKGNRR